MSTWIELIDVDDPLVSFRHVFRFMPQGLELTSDSTVRFRARDEIIADLRQAGFQTRDVRDAADRTGMELVFFAQRDASLPT